ncbi:MAG: hypothetical protein ACI4R9_00835 [Kiritimatiellia bacterium]
MTNLRNVFAVGAAVALVAVGQNVGAQEDLDDLLSDLESDTKAETAQVEPQSAEVSVAPAAEADEPAAVEEPEEAAEEPASVASEEPAPAAAEEPVSVAAEEPAPKAEEPVPAPVQAESKSDDVLDLLSELAAEDEAGAKPAVPAEEPAPAVAAEPTPKADVKPSEVTPVVVADGKPAPEPVPVEPAVPQFTGPDAELLSNIVTTERIRREAFDVQADREIMEARACMESEEYQDATKHYRIAQKLLNDSPKSAGKRKECEQGIAEGLYRAALQEDATGRRERAIKLISKAVDLRHPKARRQLEAWLAAGDPEASKTDVSEIKHRRNDQDYKDQRAKTLMHLRRSRQYLATRELGRALDECELVLVADPSNQEAIRLREKIQRKRHTILMQERKAAREGMIADVDQAWRPVYAVDAQELGQRVGETTTRPLDNDPERAREQNIYKRMKEMKLPSISFKPPATIIDAVEFFRSASKDFDNPELPLEQRGFNIALRLPEAIRNARMSGGEEETDGFGGGEEEASGSDTAGVPMIPMLSASDITFYDALKLVCDSVDFKFKVQGPFIIVMHKDMAIEEMVTRSYPVLSSFMERMDTASSDMKEMRSAGFGGNASRNNDEGDENQQRDWKEFFTLLGVQWPEGSQIMYIKTIGKLRVKNTYENLAELEKALTEMNADPKLIEIEARFVEVCQEDLNSLGFEWILNSDYSLGLGSHLSRALGIRGGAWGSSSGSSTSSSSSSTSTSSSSLTGGVVNSGGTTTSTEGSTTTSSSSSKTLFANSSGATWIRHGSASHGKIGINATGGEGSTYGTGMRYLSTLSNHISGESASNNDQFMRINAFLGGADLSMILHMLSQRSDTDLLSAPKVLTRPGEEAVMKVVTEYIYPTDYDVQLQSSSSSSSSSSGGSQSAILAVVEPQSFTMREVGVILDVTPTLTDDGNLIDLKLNTQVVDEPTWKNYGMRIPFTGNSSLQSFQGIGEILTGLSEVLSTIGTGLSDTVKAAFAETAVSSASAALENLTVSSSENITYYDAPMEQPFFHVRSIDSNVSVYPGATIVMGGLITEDRKAMDDKIPFLGDLPIIGRFFRSHSERTNKRNLLIFVTTRLVDVRGREVTMSSLEQKESDVQAAPQEDE